MRIALNGATVYTTFSTSDEALAQQIEQGQAELGQLLDLVHLALGSMSLQRTVVPHLGEPLLPGAALVSERV